MLLSASSKVVGQRDVVPKWSGCSLVAPAAAKVTDEVKQVTEHLVEVLLLTRFCGVQDRQQDDAKVEQANGQEAECRPAEPNGGGAEIGEAAHKLFRHVGWPSPCSSRERPPASG